MSTGVVNDANLSFSTGIPVSNHQEPQITPELIPPWENCSRYTEESLFSSWPVRCLCSSLIHCSRVAAVIVSGIVDARYSQKYGFPLEPHVGGGGVNILFIVVKPS